MFAEWQESLKFWQRSKLYLGSLHPPSLPHTSRHPLRTDWHHPSFQIMPLSSANMMLPFLKSFWQWEFQSMWGIVDVPVSAWAESASEWSCRINISFTAGPNTYSLRALACVYNPDMSSSSFLPWWEAPSWTQLMVFRGNLCLFEVLRCYLGIFRREDV